MHHVTMISHFDALLFALHFSVDDAHLTPTTVIFRSVSMYNSVERCVSFLANVTFG